MFPVESLAASYMEDREANNATQLAQLREQHAKALQNTTLKSATQQPHQGSVSQVLQQPRPTFLGGMFSGLVKGGTSTPFGSNSPFTSRSPTPAGTPLPSPSRVPTQSEIEAALVAEKKRDADICAMPAWYH